MDEFKLTIEKPVVIDIGAGPHPRADATECMDVHEWTSTTKKHDLHQFPYPYEDNYADKIYLGDVIEHLVCFAAPLVICEIHRILKPGGTFEITCPDVLWVMERIVKGDWKEKANVPWLNVYDDPWEDAMSYLFGGFHNVNEYKMQGMGHVNAFDEKALKGLLEKNGFVDCIRTADLRNPEPARNSVIKIICRKP